MGCAKEKHLGGWFISLSPGFADASEDVVTQLSHLFQALGVPYVRKQSVSPGRGGFTGHTQVCTLGKGGQALCKPSCCQTPLQPPDDAHSSSVWGCGCTPVLQGAVENLWD